MHSRAVLFLSLFALAGLVVVGSIVLHLTSASASTGSFAKVDAMASPAENESDVSPNLAFFRSAPPSDSPELDGSRRELSPSERASADSLRTLLRQVHAMFEPEGAGVSNSMIPYIAEMITLVNQYDHLVYRIEIVEPDAALARRRAQTLNDVLRLNVLEPSRLHIAGRQGLHAAIVDVTAT